MAMIVNSCYLQLRPVLEQLLLWYSWYSCDFTNVQLVTVTFVSSSISPSIAQYGQWNPAFLRLTPEPATCSFVGHPKSPTFRDRKTKGQTKRAAPVTSLARSRLCWCISLYRYLLLLCVFSIVHDRSITLIDKLYLRAGLPFLSCFCISLLNSWPQSFLQSTTIFGVICFLFRINWFTYEQ